MSILPDLSSLFVTFGTPTRRLSVLSDPDARVGVSGVTATSAEGLDVDLNAAGSGLREGVVATR